MSIAALLVVLATIGKALAVIAAVAAVAAPFIGPQVIAALGEPKRKRLLAAVQGAVLVVGEVAPTTPTDIDDQLVKILKIVAKELGRKSLSKKDAATATAMALTLHADPRFPARLSSLPAVASKAGSIAVTR